MNDNLLTVKAMILAFFTTLGAFLGWKGIMLLAWFGVMVLDYLSGSIAAALNGEWCSAVAREGIKHKGGGVCPHRHPVARADPAHGSCVVHYYRAGFHPGECGGYGCAGTQLADPATEGKRKHRGVCRRTGHKGQFHKRF